MKPAFPGECPYASQAADCMGSNSAKRYLRIWAQQFDGVYSTIRPTVKCPAGRNAGQRSRSWEAHCRWYQMLLVERLQSPQPCFWSPLAHHPSLNVRFLCCYSVACYTYPKSIIHQMYTCFILAAQVHPRSGSRFQGPLDDLQQSRWIQILQRCSTSSVSQSSPHVKSET